MLAPVAFFVYKRFDHTKRTFEALAANPFASESDLFIFSDGPQNEHVIDDVQRVREYVRQVKGFKTITLIEHKQNQGLAKSLIDGISRLCNQFGRVIVIEDDVLVSPNFIEFMNDALEKYAYEDQVFSICGFWPLPFNPKYNEAFFLNYFAAWGWGTWKRAWDYYDYKASGWENLLKDKRMAWDFDLQGRYHFSNMLLTQAKGELKTWDIQWLWTIYHRKKLCLFPPYSITSNIGFDDMGSHTVSRSEDWIVQNVRLGIKQNVIMPFKFVIDWKKRTALGKFYYFPIKKLRGFSLRGIFWTFYRALRYAFLFIPYEIKIKKSIRL